MEFLLQGRVQGPHVINIPQRPAVTSRGHNNTLSKPDMWKKEAEPPTKIHHDGLFWIEEGKEG